MGNEMRPAGREPGMLRFMVGALIPSPLAHPILYFFLMSTSPMICLSLNTLQPACLWHSAPFVLTEGIKLL